MFGRYPFNPFDRTARRMIDQISGGNRRPKAGFGGAEQSIVDQGNTMRVVLDVSGVDKSDINLSVTEKMDRQILQVDIEQENENSSRKIRQAIALRAPVDEELATAEHNNGILTVEFPIVDSTDAGTSIEIK